MIGALSGCVMDNESAAPGFSVASEWLVIVNGYCYGAKTADSPECQMLAGPLAEGCQRATYQTVRIVVHDRGGELPAIDALTFPCDHQEQGLPAGSFDTSPEIILEYGAYETQWQAIDTQGSIVASSDRIPLVVSPPIELAVLIPTEFDAFQPRGNEAILKASWEVMGPESTLTMRCDARGVTEVGLDVRRLNDPQGTPISLAKVPCSAGMYDSATAILAKGKYTFSYTFYNAGGETVGNPVFSELIVSTTGTVSALPGVLTP